jgi:hypothetical protein
MRIVGYPTEWNEREGLQPIDIQDIQIHASIDELNELSTFLKECAENFKGGKSEAVSIELSDSKPNPKTGISITVDIND